MNQNATLIGLALVTLPIVFMLVGRLERRVDDQARAHRKELKPKGKSATVSVYRSPGYVGRQNPFRVHCNGKLVAVMKIGHSITFAVPPGKHVFAISGSTPVVAYLVAGEELFIKCGFEGIWGAHTFEVMDPDRAKTEMTALQTLT